MSLHKLYLLCVPDEYNFILEVFIQLQPSRLRKTIPWTKWSYLWNNKLIYFNNLPPLFTFVYVLMIWITNVTVLFK